MHDILKVIMLMESKVYVCGRECVHVSSNFVPMGDGSSSTKQDQGIFITSTVYWPKKRNPVRCMTECHDV